MTIAAFKDAIESRPFRAFTIHVPDRAVEVSNPEQVIFANDGVSTVVVTPDGHIHILDVREINGLELKPNRRKAA